jgi:hypothetical protein
MGEPTPNGANMYITELIITFTTKISLRIAQKYAQYSHTAKGKLREIL